MSVAITVHVRVSFKDNFHLFAFNFFYFTHDDNLVIVSVTFELFTNLFETIDGCLHPTLMAISHILDLEFLSHQEETSVATGTMSLDLELLLDGAVGDAVRLKDEPWAIEQVAITRLFWEVWGGVPCVRVRQQQVQSNKDEGEDQDWSTVCHYRYRRLFFTISRFRMLWTRETQRSVSILTWFRERRWEWNNVRDTCKIFCHTH